MKKILLPLLTAALMVTGVQAHPRNAIFIGWNSPAEIDNFQEAAAYQLFQEVNADGGVITPANAATEISSEKYDCIWIHIDRLNVGKGNLPAEFTNETTINALKQFLADGGNLFLSKHATQLLVNLDRIDAKFAPGIYGDGDGGEGTDVWSVQAQIGYWFIADPNSDHYDPTQCYDRRDHDIYKDLTTIPDFGWPTYGLLGTGNGTAMHREDHNCMWDLNAYNNVYVAEGKNTVEKFEADNNAVVLGQWGHVQDHAVAGIVEFLPADTEARATVNKGRIIANGLAAYELAPRSGVNAFSDNIKKLTANTLDYLQRNNQISAVSEIAVSDADAQPVYFNLQGSEVSADALNPGLYIVRRGNSVSKVIVK